MFKGDVWRAKTDFHCLFFKERCKQGSDFADFSGFDIGMPKKLQKTFTLKTTYINELGLKVKKTSKKGCIKFAKAEKGATFALAITK